MNGIMEDETDRYYHICFFGDRTREKGDALDNYIFVPKQVCRIIDRSTVAIQDWYVQKKKLARFTKKYQASKVDIDMNAIRLRRTSLFKDRS